METQNYKVAEMPSDDPYDKRWAIIDDDGVILDDAQGYGYKSVQNAHKAYWFKFGGGKEKIKKIDKLVEKFNKKNKDFVKEYEKTIEYSFKEMARKETTAEEILSDLEKRFGIEVPKNIRKYIL